MKKALLVVDMQEICVGENHSTYFKYDNEKLIRAVNEVIDANVHNLVIDIKNVMKNDTVNKYAQFLAYEGTEESELVSGLHVVSEYVFTKHQADAFTNPKLNDFLKEHHIECVEVIGIDGGGCAALTALGAVKAGYRVIVNETAIQTMFEKNKEKFYKKLQEMGARFV